jgi:hypothetical protein
MIPPPRGLRERESSQTAALPSGSDTFVKERYNFDFSAIPSLNKMLVLELARCEYILRRENVIALGNNHLGEYASGAKIPSMETVKKMVRALQDRERGAPVKDDKFQRRQRQDRLRADIRSLSELSHPWSLTQHKKAAE